MDARTTALSALIACRKQGAWSDGVLKEYIARDRLDRRDAALASRLCYGVLQNRMLLDFYISGLLKGKLRDLQPVVLDILRLGAYQLAFMDKIPASAAVNEAVNQGKKYANARAAGLVNGVLRSLVRQSARLPEPPDLATKYSHPQPLVELLRQSIGDELLEPLLKSHNEAPATVLQRNPLKAQPETALHALRVQEVELQPHPWLPDCYTATATGSLEALNAFREGLVYVQDAAAKLAVLAAELQPGMQVVDGCAAPGGKSFTAAMEMENQGTIYACDIHEHKLALIEKGAERLGVSIVQTALQDATEPNPDWLGKMDAVLADVPCSGLGVIRKKPDIRYKDLIALAGLPDIQKKILHNLSSYVRPGGVLVYSTCTILKRENEEVVLAFLQAHPNFVLEPIKTPEKLELENAGMLTLLPCVQGTDGFFIAKLRRQA